MSKLINFQPSTTVKASMSKKSLLVQHTIALQFDRLKSSRREQQTLFPEDRDHIQENICPFCNTRPFFGKCYNCFHTTTPTLIA